jgi:NADH-quinone oxidoreductase subunit A
MFSRTQVKVSCRLMSTIVNDIEKIQLAVSEVLADFLRQSFTLVALLFVVFDVEVVFLYPWAVEYKELGWFRLIEMLMFMAILFVGYIYIYKKGALEWER